MDNTAVDLEHAAQEIEDNAEKQSLHSSSDAHSSDNVVGEKPEKGSHQEPAPIAKLDSRIVNVRDVKKGDEAFDHLPDHEKDIVKRQLDIPEVQVSYGTLFRYATRNDRMIMALSAFCAIVGGAVLPLMTVGETLNLDSYLRSGKLEDS